MSYNFEEFLQSRDGNSPTPLGENRPGLLAVAFLLDEYICGGDHEHLSDEGGEGRPSDPKALKMGMRNLKELPWCSASEMAP
eukprot:gene2458-biopygen11477